MAPNRPVDSNFPTATVQPALPEVSPMPPEAQALPTMTPTLTLTATSYYTPPNLVEPRPIYLVQLKGQPDQEQQAQFLAQLERQLNRPVEVVYQYNTAYNGFALKLTPQEAEWVATLLTVRQVQADLKRLPQDNLERDKD